MKMKNKNVDAKAMEIAANPHINIITYTFSFDYVPYKYIILIFKLLIKCYFNQNSTKRS